MHAVAVRPEYPEGQGKERGEFRPLQLQSKPGNRRRLEKTDCAKRTRIIKNKQIGPYQGYNN
jgi:hypothetical protein